MESRLKSLAKLRIKSEFKSDKVEVFDTGKIYPKMFSMFEETVHSSDFIVTNSELNSLEGKIVEIISAHDIKEKDTANRTRSKVYLCRTFSYTPKRFFIDRKGLLGISQILA